MSLKDEIFFNSMNENKEVVYTPVPPTVPKPLLRHWYIDSNSKINILKRRNSEPLLLETKVKEEICNNIR